MAAALGLARRALGRVWPNPAVGCVVVDAAGQVVGRGRTATGGRPHAETLALAAAGPLTRGATAYVTLEPCSHHGQTPPCADALIGAGIAHVVVAIEDADPRVRGRGLARLREAGVSVQVGVGGKEAAEINAGFFTRINRARPLVTLKLATSLDGRIALASGESRWITSEPARARGHWLRATHDAVLVGAGTALSDDPLLTCRIPGLEERSPVRILFDPKLRVPVSRQLYGSGRPSPLWVIVSAGVREEEVELRRRAGAEVLELPIGRGGRPDAAAMMTALGSRGLTRLLVEGGSRMAAALLDADVVDRIAWFRAPVLLGADAMPAASLLGLDRLDRAPRFRLLEIERLGPDLLEQYVRDDRQ